MNRRSFLKLIAFTTIFLSFNLISKSNRIVRFEHGIASGDPTPEKVILWTRVSSNSDNSILVFYEISNTVDFKTIIASGKKYADRRKDFTVKVDAKIPKRYRGQKVFYRFRAEGAYSQIGTTFTLPKDVENFKIAVFSCSNYPAGYFNAYDSASNDESIDLAVHLGDYLYEYKQGEYATDNAIRLNRQPIPNKEIVSLSDYRQRHAQYKSDVDLQKLHSSMPVLCAWDDHEITNDAWKDNAENHQINEGSFSLRKRNAIKAYYEWMPVREPKTPFNNWKRYKIGKLIDLKLLETRISSRSKQVNLNDHVSDDGNFQKDAFFKELNNAQRSLLGNQQLDFIKENDRDDQTWNLYAQQVLLATLKLPTIPDYIIDALPDYQSYYKTVIKEDLPYNLDAWDGYPAERKRFLNTVRSISNKNIFIAGDTHNCWANNINEGENFIGAELGTPSVTSPGASENFNGLIPNNLLENSMLMKNKNLKWTNLVNRGYLTIDFTKDIATAEFIAIDNILSKNYKTKVLKRIEIFPGEKLT